MAEERALFPGSGPVPAHVPPHLVRSFDFWRDLADRPRPRTANTARSSTRSSAPRG